MDTELATCEHVYTCTDDPKCRLCKKLRSHRVICNQRAVCEICRHCKRCCPGHFALRASIVGYVAGSTTYYNELLATPAEQADKPSRTKKQVIAALDKAIKECP